MANRKFIIKEVRINESGRVSFIDKNGKCVYSQLEKDMLVPIVPKVYKNAFSWTYPILEMVGGERPDYVIFDGVVIYRDVNTTNIKWMLGSYPINPNLEEDIRALPSLYRFGLLAMFYYNERTSEFLRYMSLLLKLNQVASKIYHRHNRSDGFFHRSGTRWLETDNYLGGIIATNLEMLLPIEQKQEVDKLPFSIHEYLEELGVKDISLLTKKDYEILGLFVEYMKNVNLHICKDVDMIFSDKYKLTDRWGVYLEERRMLEIVYEALTCWQAQDMLQKANITEETMKNLDRQYILW